MRKKLMSKKTIRKKSTTFIALATSAMCFFSVIPKVHAANVPITNLGSLSAALGGGATPGDTLLFTPGLGISIVGSGITGTVTNLSINGQKGRIVGTGTTTGLINMAGLSINQISNIEMNQGNSTTNGGALNVDSITGGITGTNNQGGTAFRNNHSDANGGAVYVDTNFAGGITNNIHIDSNTAAFSGGGIYVGLDFFGGIVGASGDTHFDNNKALGGSGGGMYVGNDFNGRIYANYFSKNEAFSSGGGLYVGNDFNGYLDGYSFFSNNKALNGSGGGLYVLGNFNGNLQGAIVSGNEANVNGGGIYIGGILSGNINGSYTSNKVTIGSGGGLYINSMGAGNYDLGANFTRNTAQLDGGGVYIGTGSIRNINGGTYNGNVATTGSGGFIHINNGNITGDINNVNMALNEAGLNGGAISVDGSINGHISNGTFATNKALGGSGGAINVTGSINGGISNKSQFNFNTANVNGGAINVGGTINNGITGSIFLGNTATTGNGGAINATAGIAGGISNNDFAFNNATAGDGGAINTAGSINGSVDNNSFFTNKANSGGAISVNANIVDAITNNIFLLNEATGGSGGAINVTGTIIGDIDSNNFDQNTATGGNGGAVAAGDIAGDIINTSFTGNSATGDGGAIFVNNDITGDTTSSLFRGNSAVNGGAMYAGNDITGAITNSRLSYNTATTNGGALYVGNDITSNISGSEFSHNFANGGRGGAWYVNGDLNVTIDQGTTTTFTYNQDSAGTNSIYFNGTTTANFTTNGTLFMYDPMSSAGSLTINKNGTGLMLLGGQNNLNNSTFNVNSGNLRATFDTAQNSFHLNAGTGSFNLAAGSILEIVPTATFALINATGGIHLDGQVTLASDYRNNTKLTLNTDTVVLRLSQAYATGGTILSTSGKFSLGIYDYEYEGLTWTNGNRDLSFKTRAARLNPERSGGYSGNVPLHTYVANHNQTSIFEQMGTTFSRLRLRDIADEEQHTYLWGTMYDNVTKRDQVDLYQGSTTKVPGMILGNDWLVGKRSFNGLALSVAWPEYKQGTLDADGKDIRLNLYGGSLLKNDLEFGYIVSIGFGDISQSRLLGAGGHFAKYNVSNYAVGMSFAKPIELKENKVLKPFVNFEYIKVRADGYEETGDPATSLVGFGHSQDLFRSKLGVQYIVQKTSDSYMKASIFYQTLLGDTNPNSRAYVKSVPGTIFTSPTMDVDKHSLGFGFTWNKNLTDKTRLNLDYLGHVGSKSMSHGLSVTF